MLKRLCFSWFAAVGCVIGGPTLEVNPKLLDLGLITDRSKPVPMEFTLKNTGDELLKIEKVKPACGCTGANIDREELKPGETAVVKASFKPGSFEGTVQKNISVKSNDAKRPTTFLSFKAKLPFTDVGLRLQPKFKEFRAYPWQQGLRVQIGIQNCDSIGAANVLAIDLPDGWVLNQASTLPKKVDPEKRQFFYIVNPSADRSVEFHDIPIIFHTDHPNHPQIKAMIGFRPPAPKK